MNRGSFRQVWGYERLVKRVAALEIVDGILVGFSKNPDADQIENHLAEILAPGDAPILEDGRDHRAEFFHRVKADAVEQLRTGDVGRAVVALFAELDGVIQRVAEEKVGVAGVPWVVGADEVECFGEIAFLHLVYFSRPGSLLEIRHCNVFERDGVIRKPLGKATETMRDVRNRQQPLLVAALFCSLAAGVAEPTRGKASAADDLRLVTEKEAALIAREAGAEEWKKFGDEYAALVKEHPQDVAIRDAHADYLWGMNDREGALREWLAAEKIDPQNAKVLNHLGGTYLAMGEPRESLAFFLRATEAEPANAATHFSVANVASVFRHDVGRTEEECFTLALKHFAEAHRLAPKNPEFARGYAETFYLVGNPDWRRAVQVWTDYLNLMPEKNFALLNLARVHINLGEAENARACLAQVTGTEYDRLKNRLTARIEAGLSPVKPMESLKIENSLKPGIDEAPSPP